MGINQRATGYVKNGLAWSPGGFLGYPNAAANPNFLFTHRLDLTRSGGGDILSPC